MSQKDVFMQAEGDAWYQRNKDHLGGDRNDPVLEILSGLRLQPRRILEVGSSNGWRLIKLRDHFAAECHGVEPSAQAVAEARRHGIDVVQGTADVLPFDGQTFDLVILGFCLYLCDPADHFRIAAEVDRVLSPANGVLIIRDFHATSPVQNQYHHRPGIFSHKMAWDTMFTWHPAYRLIARRYEEADHDAETEPSLEKDAQTFTDVLIKNISQAFASRALPTR